MGRQAIHYKQAEKKPRSKRQLSGQFHLHFCSNPDCRLVYTDACKTLDVNARCHACRGVRRPVWVSARDPQECCIGNCFMVTNEDEIVRYKLAGPGPWFQCTKCARVHGWTCT